MYHPVFWPKLKALCWASPKPVRPRVATFRWQLTLPRFRRGTCQQHMSHFWIRIRSLSKYFKSKRCPWGRLAVRNCGGRTWSLAILRIYTVSLSLLSWSFRCASTVATFWESTCLDHHFLRVQRTYNRKVVLIYHSDSKRSTWPTLILHNAFTCILSWAASCAWLPPCPRRASNMFHQVC